MNRLGSEQLWSGAIAVAAGPFALAAFFLPLAHGPSLLEPYRFSGLELTTLAGRLQTLDLTAPEAIALWVARLALIGIPIAGAWQTLLAPAHRWHPGYRASGWFLVAVAMLLLVAQFGRRGAESPPWGLALLAAGALVFLAVRFRDRTGR